MTTTVSMNYETRFQPLFVMPKEKKINKTFRMSPFAMSLIEAERQERAKASPDKEKPSEASVLEDCIYIAASQNPKLRERIIKELSKDPRFAAVIDSLRSQGDKNAES